MCLRVPWILVVRRGEDLVEMELELWWAVETPCRWGSFADPSCVLVKHTDSLQSQRGTRGASSVPRCSREGEHAVLPDSGPAASQI